MGLMDTLGHAMLDNEKLHFSATADTSPGEQWLLALGAQLAAFSGSYVNSLEGRDGDDERIRGGMAQQWGITDRASFESTAKWLVDEGQRGSCFALWEGMQKMQVVRNKSNALVKLFAGAIVEIQAHLAANPAAIAAATGLKQIEVSRRLRESQEWVPDIDKSLGVQTAAVRSFVAWDAVRLVNVSRWALQLGLISRDEFAQYADGLSGAVGAAYSGWQEVAAAYVLAGLDYSEAREESLVRVFKLLAKDPQSPYRTTPFSLSA